MKFEGQVAECIKGEKSTKVVLSTGESFYIEKDSSIKPGSYVSVEIKAPFRDSGNYFTPIKEVKIGGKVELGITRKDRVFIAHGRDEHMKESVARFLENLGIEAVILKEKAHLGQTIIEKIEANSDINYAIVLLSPDDVGCLRDKGKSNNTADLNGRARQNVIFESGYFMAKLGRANVCVLIKGDVEIPSDLNGCGYHEFDDNEGWKIKVQEELKHAGLV